MRITSLQTPMVIVKDEWVATALTDNQMVVELLLRLKHTGTVPSENNPSGNLPLRWGFRQRRSRQSRFGFRGFQKKETDSALASPMSPLGWSGGSGSGGSPCPSTENADGFESASLQASCSTSTGSESKTFLELKDAENLQLKERLNLEKKIATYDERSAKNQSLKRIKLEYSGHVKNIPVYKSNLDESSKKRELLSSISQVKNKQHVSESYRESNDTKSSEEKGFFFLPDLNMTPTEDVNTLYDTS